jgi:AraC family transcriptional regulator
LPALKKIRDYVHANLAETIEVNDLASLAGRSPFHFTRVFARSIGVTPYRYVVHLRLRAAIERIQRGMSLAEVAADTGFADQSHLSRWIRRVHGVTPSQLA